MTTYKITNEELRRRVEQLASENEKLTTSNALMQRNLVAMRAHVDELTKRLAEITQSKHLTNQKTGRELPMMS